MTAPARIHHVDTEFGSSMRAVRAPDPRLQPLMYRDLYGFNLRRAGFSSWLEPPRPAVTLMIDLEGSIRADGERLPSAWIGGLGERPTVVGLRSRDYASADIELTPLGAYTVLGRPLAELGGASARRWRTCSGPVVASSPTGFGTRAIGTCASTCSSGS